MASDFVIFFAQYCKSLCKFDLNLSFTDALEDFNKHDTATKSDQEATNAVNDNTSELWNAEFMQ